MALNMRVGAVPKMKAKICMIGDSGVGKTSLVRRYVMDYFDDKYIVTLGTKITKKSILLRETPLGTPLEITLTIWDIMGQESFRELLKESYFYGANGLLAVTDMTEPGTLVSIHRWIKLASGVAGKVPVHLVANKVDLENKITVLPEDVEATAKEVGGTFDFTSAKSGDHVEESFQSVAASIIQARFLKGLGIKPRKV